MQKKQKARKMRKMPKMPKIPKKGFLFVLPLTLALAAWALAAGDAADPLASLSYLNGIFTSAVDAAVNARLDASDALLLENGGNGLEVPAVPSASAGG